MSMIDGPIAFNWALDTRSPTHNEQLQRPEKQVQRQRSVLGQWLFTCDGLSQ